ncbi:hypothetical protein KFE25_008743 [Diacronema lutheri]|uniref:Calmodulin n=2 Tax=Diacronema lutheri TaxID=2081491 RepID=A0A8J5XX51_DIALT|nr:hypothetical protein KFE25_008743 [Diacronema lutheri]
MRAGWPAWGLLVSSIGAPLRPRVPSWSDLTSSSVLVSWMRPDSPPGEPPASAYELQRKDGLGKPWLSLYEGPAFATRDTGLRPQMTYQYRVRALSERGYSEFSESVALHCRAKGATDGVRRDVRDADDNADGVLDRAELRELIEQGLSGAGSTRSLDDELRNALRTVDRNVDGLLTAEEVESYREALGSLMTVPEVADWVAHAVQLPQYAAVFRSNAISGYEFRALLENGGAMLRDELGIASRLHRRQLMRAISMQLYAVGSAPAKPAPPRWIEPREDGGTVVWEAPESNGAPVHSYRLERNDGIGAEWLSAYEGPALSLREAGLREHTTYQYRVQAWSILGHSEYSDPTTARCRATGAGAQSLGDVRNADGNDDGVLDRSELRELIAGELGEHALDADAAAERMGASTRHEVEEQLRTALRNVDRNVDGLLTADELETYRAQLGSALSVDEVVDWVAHAVQLPQYAHAFRDNAIVGHDFRGLLENGGELLRDELGVESRLHRRQITRAISMRLYGMGVPPAPPPRPSARATSSHQIVVTWRAAEPDALPHVHKFRVQRRDSRRGAWRSVYDGPAVSFVDVVEVVVGVSYEYRVQAWSLIGGSAWSPSATVAAWSVGELVSMALSALSALGLVWHVPAVQHAARRFGLRVWAAYKDIPLPSSPRPRRAPLRGYLRHLGPRIVHAVPLPIAATLSTISHPLGRLVPSALSEWWRASAPLSPDLATPVSCRAPSGATTGPAAPPPPPRAAAPAVQPRSHWSVLQEQLRSADMMRHLKAVSASLTPSSSVPADLRALGDGAAADQPPRPRDYGGGGSPLCATRSAKMLSQLSRRAPTPPPPARGRARTALPPPAVEPDADAHDEHTHTAHAWHLSDWAVHALAGALKSLDSMRRVAKDSSLAHLHDDDINDIDRCYLCHRTVGRVPWRIRHICRQCRRIFCADCGRTPHPLGSVICNDGCICRHHLHAHPALHFSASAPRPIRAASTR